MSEPAQAATAGSTASRRGVLGGAAVGLTSLMLPPAAAAASTGGYTPSPIASFSAPWGIAVAPSGDVYVADRDSNRIRRITGAGVVSTIATSADEPFFLVPESIALIGSTLYVTTGGFGRIYSLPVTGGTPQLVTDAIPTPRWIVPDGAGALLVSSSGQDRLYRLTTGGAVSTVQDSFSADVTITGPVGLAVADGSIYVARPAAGVIDRVASDGAVTTFASLGSGDGAQLYGLASDGAGGLVVTEYLENRIRRVSSSGTVSAFVGGTQGLLDGTGAAARFTTPLGIARHPTTGDLIVADTGNHSIRRVTAAGVVATISGVTGSSGTQDD